MPEYFISERNRRRLINWLHSQAQVTAFPIYDEQIRIGSYIIDDKKGWLLFPANEVKFKIHKRDNARALWLVY